MTDATTEAPTMPELMKRHEHHLRQRNRSQLTIDGYRYDLHSCLDFVRAELQRTPVQADLQDPDRLQRWIDSLPCSPVTKNRKAASVSSFFEFLKLRKLAAENPMRLLILPKEPKRVRGFLSEEQAAKLVEAPLAGLSGTPPILRLRDAAILELLYGGALRASEATGLDLDRVQMDVPCRGFVTLRVLGKGDRERYVVLAGKGYAALKGFLLRRSELLKAPTNALFLTEQEGERLGRTGICHMVYRYAQPLGFRAFPHLLRHSCATHLMNRGVHLRVLQAFLGHEDPTSTAKYTHTDLMAQIRKLTSRHPRAGGGLLPAWMAVHTGAVVETVERARRVVGGWLDALFPGRGIMLQQGPAEGVPKKTAA